MKAIRTPRLRLRPATPDDAGFLVALMNDPSYLHFIGDRGVRTLEDARQYLASAVVYRYDDGLGLNVVEALAGGQAVGICGLVQRPDLVHADLGYALLPQHAGRGYAAEAARATLDHAFATLGLARVLAITRPDNLRSRRVLEAIGMRLAEEAFAGYEDRCVYRKDRPGGPPVH
jgi:RimJ/RimL family protein N-acetyltransferase